MGTVEIVDYDPSWPDDFAEAARRLRVALGHAALRIDHIGSTSVPGLASKDVIDIQVSVGDASDLPRVGRLLEEADWRLRRHIYRDHAVPGWPGEEHARRKVFLREPPGSRRTHVHVRVSGHASQRYPLLFRDYLRAHPRSAEAYATLKRDLAELLGHDAGRYADVKDAACDLIYFAAEAWAGATGWDAGRSDP